MKLTIKHDEFVRKCLTDLNMAQEFLEKYLHPEIKAKCDFNQLSIVAGTYIEDDLKAHASDIVYKFNLKDNEGCAYVYALIEHQSTPDRLMPFRILRYQLAIIQKHMEEYPGDKLPLVAPIVFYNGKTIPYPYSNELADLFADKELFDSIGLGNFKLADLTVTEDNEILQDKKLVLLEMLLKHIHDRDFNSIIDYIVKAFKIAELQQVNTSLVNSAIFYLLSGREREELNQLITKLKQDLPNYGDTFMTYAEELRQEGIQLGKQEGIQLGEQRGIQLGEQRGIQQGKINAQIEMAKKLIKANTDTNFISEVTDLKVEEIIELKNLI